MQKRLAFAALLAAAAIVLAGCADDADSGASDAQFNDADVAFAQSMIPHHQQAVEMAEIAASRAESTEVRELAADIEAAQEPEIDTMTAWLEAWGEEVPSTGGDMGGMDHGGMSAEEMGGMMSQEDMNALEAASGDEFDEMFLTMMIEHHEGAIEMAQTEQAEGENPDAIALAEKIEKDQEAEIEEIRSMLES